MTDFVWSRDLALDVQYGYVTRGAGAPRIHHPRVVLNGGDTTVLRTLRDELRRCDGFTFSVAFVSPSALAMIKTDLLEFRGQGRIITSDYLAFNSPHAFAELLDLSNRGVDVRIHSAAAFHPKGYIFQHEHTVSAMVGSANLTANALLRNHEWNLLVSSSNDGDLARQLDALLAEQVADSAPITASWVERYTASYVPPGARPRRAALPGPPPQSPEEPLSAPGVDASPTSNGTLIAHTPATPTVIEAVPVVPLPERPADAPAAPPPHGSEGAAVTGPPAILPNRMQRAALEAIAEVRSMGAKRALIISATGTGKTILSALDARSQRPRRLLFVVHREQILDRTIDEFHRVLGGPRTDYGKLSGSSKEIFSRYLFATVQTLSRDRWIERFDRDAFDYIVVDEVHRAGARSHQSIMSYFTPRFLLGMTATPERPDAFNVFELFDYTVPYEIRLKEALEADMLVPFHYYGVTDIEFEDGTTTTEETRLDLLTSPERVRHIIGAIETYGQHGIRTTGLIFCSRRQEAIELSEALNEATINGAPVRTVCLTGGDPIEYRNACIARLESGELDYIVTVDVFNEGVDIPSVNQVILLRNTQSPIVFVQQLGRGLRKAPGKEYLVVIDFIGNYTNNFMIPIALFGDNSLNKESLRKNLAVAEERGAIAGLSSVQFDRIAEERVFRSIAQAQLTSTARLKAAVIDMYHRVGHVPELWDFVRFDSADPVLLATTRQNYPELARSFLRQPSPFSPVESTYLTHLSHEVLSAKRPHEAIALAALLRSGRMALPDLGRELAGLYAEDPDRTLRSTVDTFTTQRHSEADRRKYDGGIARVEGDVVALQPEFWESYTHHPEFRLAVNDLVRTAQHLVATTYAADRAFTPERQYSRKEVARILTWPRSYTSTIYGYRVDDETAKCPIFVTLHKAGDIAASTAYEDRLIDRHTMQWFSKSRRTLESADVQKIRGGAVDLDVFVKKDDAEGVGFYYLGQARVADAEQTTMSDDKGNELPVVRMILRFDEPVSSTLYDYFHPTVAKI